MLDYEIALLGADFAQGFEWICSQNDPRSRLARLAAAARALRYGLRLSRMQVWAPKLASRRPCIQRAAVAVHQWSLKVEQPALFVHGRRALDERPPAKLPTLKAEHAVLS